MRNNLSKLEHTPPKEVARNEQKELLKNIEEIVNSLVVSEGSIFKENRYCVDIDKGIIKELKQLIQQLKEMIE